jgi:hypothetical protein
MTCLSLSSLGALPKLKKRPHKNSLSRPYENQGGDSNSLALGASAQVETP